ncbi:MAG TPA: methyltransferase domain-containing protein [Candidatus Saccharimonadales bacterium]|nr:methyltransferase domain-containing protein [Candidatus Saccharimonadales bacterium]
MDQAQYDIDYYRQINAEEGEQARRLAELLIWKYAPKSVLDVGCATGLYLRPFLDQGIKGQGVDYAEAAVADEVLQIPRSAIKIVDITKQSIGARADLSLCIEVLEHIPESGAASAIKHLSQTAPIIIFSAAQPGQGGRGHINCQPKEYWQQLFTSNGYVRDETSENYLKIIMQSGYHLGWLINNLMIYLASA